MEQNMSNNDPWTHNLVTQLCASVQSHGNGVHVYCDLDHVDQAHVDTRQYGIPQFKDAQWHPTASKFIFKGLVLQYSTMRYEQWYL